MVMKYITNGASDFLIKPVRIEELKNIWQHVFRKKIGEEQIKNNNAQHIIGQLLSPPNIVPSPCPSRTTGMAEAAMALKSEVRETSGTVTDIRDLRKSRLSWTMQLHCQFIRAVNSLGSEKAVPKKILEVMNVKHLTRQQVASHLQKYRLHQRKSTQTLCKDDAASSSSHPTHEPNDPKTQLFNHSSNSVYLDEDGCMEITDYSLPMDDLSSGSDCMLG
ncbi:hypothetical protein PR202_ga00428 [Eleusine coracana subsp. coracana]|uniref:Uncharacterized protein n=1 Tax=Eleusine coracana subsp. coracana TaxID=191504 RepID=A0AAV5BHF0_ELECO|nr:hypothetical protein PR202_ga00428 [Eleusine coracana subsp. coracana]